MYIQHLLDKTGLNQTELAARAGLNVSTLSAFLTAKDGKRGLGGKTLHALGTHTGIWFRGVESGRVVSFPSVAPQRGFAEADAVPYRLPAEHGEDPVARAVKAMMIGHNASDPWELKSRALEAAGYHHGDILVVDLANVGPRPGEVVCAEVYNYKAGAGTEIVFRIFEPPCLVAAPVDRSLLRPFVIDSSVVIKGTVLASIRPRRDAA